MAEILRFYDTLHLNLKQVDAFERLALGMLEPAVEDRGAERLAQQTRFLAVAFRAFEQLTDASAAFDEHLLRRRVLAEAAPQPWRHTVVAVGDRAFDACGLCPADWDLLARVPGLECLDVVATETTLAGALHERIHQWLPGIEEVRAAPGTHVAPILLVPAGGGLVHAVRDREEEVTLFARVLREKRPVPSAVEGPVPSVVEGPVPSAVEGPPLDRTALVVRRPLPYVYLAREVLRSAGVPSQMFDALPLAAEPCAAALDLVFAVVESGFARGPAVALLRSPHFEWGAIDVPALDRALAEAGYLGGLDALEAVVTAWEDRPGRLAAAHRAGRLLVTLAHELRPLSEPASTAAHLDCLLTFLTRHERLPDAADPLRPRLLRARAATLDVLTTLRDAHARFDATPVDFEPVVAIIRRGIEAHTFTPLTGEGGVHVIDADSARFGDFDLVQLAGLVDAEWPESPRRNIFYPRALLRELGWPSESERVDGIRGAFTDLLRLPSSVLVVSTFTLEDDALVAASPLLDVVTSADLVRVERTASSVRIFEHEALALEPVETQHLAAGARAAARRRIDAAAQPRERPGATRGHRPPAYAVSALERYQDCPFRYFAANVLRLEEPLEDEPARSPRARGRFVHEVLQRFFEAWEARGGGAITVDRLEEARVLFRTAAEPMLAALPEIDAALEGARLFGSAVSAGIADLVLELEAAHPDEVRGRWIEHEFEGEFALGGNGRGRIPLKGIADRVDLLPGNRLRVFDYKSGYPPDPKRALQVSIYALCAQEQLAAGEGAAWAIDEAAYLAFTGARAVVPVIRPGTTASGVEAVLAGARDRLVAAVDAIERGEFPPRPHELRLCARCAFPSVCRKDYVGDE
ncbi:MAG: PD-(D/E)XK nuclease family protein [Acidobacteria bacterium]|nr:PD-(D/E)XK nuclease family protein [Acidobacteriota bacterium]